jgi:hypothetical protein
MALQKKFGINTMSDSKVKKIVKEEVSAVLKEEPSVIKGAQRAHKKAIRNLKQVMLKAMRNLPIALRNDDTTLIEDYSRSLSVMAKMLDALIGIEDSEVWHDPKRLSKALTASVFDIFYSLDNDFEDQLTDLQYFIERDWSFVQRDWIL